LKSISVIQHGETITVENSHANFHLNQVGNNLQLYVPRDEDAREECFLRQLPRRLIKHFLITDPNAEALFNSIIGCRSLIAVERILEDAGIVEVEGIDRTSDQALGARRPNVEERTRQDDVPTSPASHVASSVRSGSVFTPEAVRAALSETDSQAGRAHVPIRSPAFDNGHPSPSSTGALFSQRGPIIPLPVNHIPTGQTVYAVLLERVIQSARDAALPRFNRQWIVDRSQRLFPIITSLQSIYPTRSSEWKDKIGAAGELFVRLICSPHGTRMLTL
jgi:hypothetical protein